MHFQSFNRLAVVLSSVLLFSFSLSAKKEAVDYVNPYIGNISHMLVPTFPTIQLPNSLMRIYPTRGDYTSEYLDGLPIVVTNHRERSAFRLSVTQDGDLREIVSTRWDQERITPYDYHVQITDNSIDVHLAVSHQSAIYDLEFCDTDKPVDIILFTDGGDISETCAPMTGRQRLKDGMYIYFAAEFSQQPEWTGTLEGRGKVSRPSESENRKTLTENVRRAVVAHFPKGTSKVSVRYGISLIDEKQAYKNLVREQGDAFDLKSVAKAGRKIWNETLENIKVKGGTEDQLTVFYTSYYRSAHQHIAHST